MKFLNQLTKNLQRYQRLIGLTPKLIQELAKKAELYWNEAEQKRKIGKPRHRAIGGGRTYKLLSIEHKLIAVLIYYKTYITQELLGLIIDLDQSNVSRLLSKMNSIIEKIADPELATYLSMTKLAERHINNWEDFIKQYPDLKDVSTDATEQRVYRSVNHEQQKEYFSGKKKQHSAKTQISVSSRGRIIHVSKTYPGSVHDKRITDEEQIGDLFPQLTLHTLDSGYQGIVEEYPKHHIMIPIKKKKGQELSADDKKYNTGLSRIRVKVENGLSRIKKFRILSYLYRGPISCYNQIFRNIVALVNFRLMNSITI
jgi:DDE superfamily endonuclease/Helix-turn-helix of DDE superfamily endonuclease